MSKISFRFVPVLLCLAAGITLNSRAADIDTPQAASADDMKIFEPYIGKFRSEAKLFDDSDIEYFFTVSYQWYDQGKSIVKYVVAMEIPAQERSVEMSEGFYGYDPFNKNLYVFGAFTRGQTGWGTVGKFDHETGARETWARSMNPENTVIHVRDTFRQVDSDNWTNKTFIRPQGEAEWKLVVDDQYSRMTD